MNNFNANYIKILSVLSDLNIPEQYQPQIRRPKLTDRELIAMNFAAEFLSIDSEHQLFRVISNTELGDKITRTVYNRRKRKLVWFMESIRERMHQQLNQYEDYFIVDSMPLEVCKLSRSSRSKICKESYYSSPDKGYCASQQMHFYGYKLHATCSTTGVFHSIDISKASVHDIHYLKDLNHQLHNCVLIGKGIWVLSNN